MKIKLDENLPYRLATLLKDLGHDVHTLHGEFLLGHADGEIGERRSAFWNQSRRDDRT
jgi:predicted nuclease of predicted toxin-antitoxin system